MVRSELVVLRMLIILLPLKAGEFFRYLELRALYSHHLFVVLVALGSLLELHIHLQLILTRSKCSSRLMVYLLNVELLTILDLDSLRTSPTQKEISLLRIMDLVLLVYYQGNQTDQNFQMRNIPNLTTQVR